MSGCGSSSSSTSSKAGVPSETSWLTPCASDADCTRGQCLCGVCSEGCDGDGDCAGSREAGCFDVASPGLTERCSSSSTAAEPGICLALCETDADCRLGETCWFDACVPSLTSVEPPESAATPDASDYFDVDTDVDFSQPVSLPTPELAIDGFADELVGEWSGRGEPLTAYSGPSDAGARLVISESAGAVVGEFHWEFGLIDGGSFPGPFAAARDPDVGYPTEVDAENYGGLRWPNPRIPYRLFDGALTAGRFT
ncbi:MAG TPA: hypothetical protein VM686_25115, partial [Polyangiaceae bacterium]|nr:hypothetical protein [Polyangiaceae bacterium]